VRCWLPLALLLACAPARAQRTDGPFFVYLGSFSTKPAAQAHAQRHGGWVLRTDLYSGLAPGFFAAVLGPFHERTDAETALALVRPDLPDAFVREAGQPVLPRALGEAALLSAVLGDLVVEVSTAADDGNPCAPSEPHLTVLVGFEQTRGTDEDAPAAGFWLIERTGEVRPVAHCDD
jgi:hypothetical protein